MMVFSATRPGAPSLEDETTNGQNYYCGCADGAQLIKTSVSKEAGRGVAAS
jgi:hypothetical protein